MRENDGWPLTAELAVVSDIHLGHCADERGRFLLHTIQRLAKSDVRTFVMLGDIFDFSLGSSGYFRRKFAPIGAALTRLAASGTRVIFFEGNHEFNTPRFRWQGVEFIEEGDFLVELSDGTRVLMTHGDMLYPSKVYAAFRNVVKSGFVKQVASFFPGRFIDKMTLKSAQISRSQDDSRTMNHEGLLATANRWLAASNAEHGIFGHFHVPYAEPRVGAQGKILSLECWDRPNLLIYRSGEFWRGFLSQDGALEVVKAESLMPKLRGAP